MPPHATYLFKHALVQDAAYSTLLREPRRALHARIAENLESQFAEIAETQPDLPCAPARKPGSSRRRRSCGAKQGSGADRSALAEAIEQLIARTDQIATFPQHPARSSRRDHAASHTHPSSLLKSKGYVAPEARAAVERARLLIEQAEALGEHPSAR